MTNEEVGRELVELVNTGRSLDAVDKLYGQDIVSIEGPGSALPQRVEGFTDVRAKSVRWYEAHETHASKAVGPFCGHGEDRFAVLFEMDVTHRPSGERMRITEVGVYTVVDGQIVQEEFLYERA